jgi:hypothetical protein
MRRVPVKDFPGYIFWSYRKDNDLPVEIVIENVILYGDVKDMKKLKELVTIEEYRKVVEKIKSTGRFKKRTHFVEQIILD